MINFTSDERYGGNCLSTARKTSEDDVYGALPDDDDDDDDDNHVHHENFKGTGKPVCLAVGKAPKITTGVGTPGILRLS